MMRTSELRGAMLDYWVARAMGYQTDITKIKPGGNWCDIEIRNLAPPDFTINGEDSACAIAMVPNAMREFPACVIGQKIGRSKNPFRSSWFYPSTLWNHGGPIIEQERIKLMPTIPTGKTWYATMSRGATLAEMEMWRGQADTPLVAAMRAYVASKFGNEVQEGSESNG